MQVSHGFIHQDILNLISDAQQVLVLVTPYLDPWQGLITAIERAHASGVRVQLILRGGADYEKQAAAAKPLRPYLDTLRFIERLHAKIYLSEKAAVLTSMNLVKTSALESIELAVSVSRALHPESYQQAFRVVESLMKTAEQDRLRSTVRPLTSVAEPARESTSRMREPSRRSTGHCIRCKEDLPLNPEKPLCPSCYKIWSKYEDADYAEEYCHHCGKKHATSLRKPVCRACYGAMA